MTCRTIVAGRVTCQLLVAVVLAVLFTPSFAADDAQGKIPDITIDGLEDEPAENVRSHLRLAAEPCDAPRWRLRRLFQLADDDVEKALRPFGYYAPRVTKQFSAGKPCWSARFSIDAGKRLQWSRVDIQIRGEAEDDPAFRELLARLQPRVGEPLIHADYETVKAELLLLASRHGFRDGSFTTHELRVDPGAGTAEAILHFESGARYRFGEVNFDQDAFAPDFVQRYNEITAGDFYDAAAVARLQRDLLDSGLFTIVEVKPDYGPNDAKVVPVNVRLVPRKRHAYLMGAGATTDEGPRLRLGYENWRINRYGHTGEAALLASAVRSSLDFAYNVPLQKPQRERLSLQAGYQEEHDNDTDSEQYKLGVRHIQRRPGDTVRTLFLEAIDERFEAGTDVGRSTLLMPGISWDWRNADNMVYAKHGWRMELEFKAASTALLSDVDFLRGYLRVKGVESLLGGRLIGRSELGYSLVSDFSELPVSQRFFAGGDNSVRGYGYRSLGPLDVNGDVVGGRNLLTASIEYERPVSGPWSVALFADTGDAFDDTQINLHHAVGIGLRWRSPIGPIRLDLAHPLDKGEDAIRFHFSLGPDL